ncbi:hypothetical protein [Thermithiobacillus plumbiphilus]|uniref:Uncharacterized protein n=1 Tax=Thermithiobacillus plumbiphilus TaxID=1729899 RepID=A0ABU9D7Z9_9PROT
MLHRVQTTVVGLAMTFIMLASASAMAAMSTEDLTRLKASGVGESVIRMMVENGYTDVDRILKLRSTGFTDETISAIIKSDLKTTSRPLPQPQAHAEKTRAFQAMNKPASGPDAKAVIQTSGDVKIEQYIALGDPIVQESLKTQNASISLLADNKLKIEWDGSKIPPSISNPFGGGAFPSPFYWDIEKGDRLFISDEKSNSFVLRTGRAHQGKPETDKARYWLIELSTNNADLLRRVKSLVAE